MMKRYLIFGNQPYEPYGGLDDLIVAVDSAGDLLEELEEYINNNKHADNIHFLDVVKFKAYNVEVHNGKITFEEKAL